MNRKSGLMNKYKKLALNTAVFAIGSFGSKILVIFLTKLYTHFLGKDELGIKELLEPTALFLQPIFTFALQEYLIRFGLDKNYNKKEVFTTSSVITLAGMVLMALVVPFLRLIPALKYLKGYTVILIVYVITSSLRMLCQQFVRSIDMVKLFSLDGILATLTLLIFNLIFIAGFKMGVYGFMLAVILSDFLSAAYLFIKADLRKYAGMRFFNSKLGGEMIRFAAPLIPTIVMWTITSLSDRLFINSMHSDMVTLGKGTVGIYGTANRFPNLISMVSTIFLSAWNMSAITENDSADRNKFYEKVYSAYESVLFIAGAGLLFVIKPVTDILTDYSKNPELRTVYIYTPILIGAVIFMCLNQFLGSIYSATKHSKNSFWTAFGACAVNLLMNYFLIPIWGIQGAALATFLSYFFCFWLRIVDARYYVPFRFNGGKCLMNTALLGVMCVVVIAGAPLKYLWTFIITACIIALNFSAMLATVKKMLKRA